MVLYPSLDFFREEYSFPRQGGELNFLPETVLPEGFPQEARGKLPRSFLSGNRNYLTNSINCPSLFQPCLINISNTKSGPSLRWIPSLKRACALRSRVHLGVPRRGRGSSGAMVTACRPDAPRALYQEPVSIGV